MQGLQQSVLDENMKDLDLDVVTQAINTLLGKVRIHWLYKTIIWNFSFDVQEVLQELDLRFPHCRILCLQGHIQLFQQKDTLVYKEANRDEVAK